MQEQSVSVLAFVPMSRLRTCLRTFHALVVGYTETLSVSCNSIACLVAPHTITHYTRVVSNPCNGLTCDLKYRVSEEN